MSGSHTCGLCSCRPQLDHLTSQQKQQLQVVFEKYKRVFDGTLRKHPTAKIDIEVVPNVKPIYQNPYPVLFKRKALFQRELNNMIADGLFTQIGESEWGFPASSYQRKMEEFNGSLTSEN